MITLPHIYQLTGVEKQVLVCTKHSSIMNLVAKEISSFVYKNTSISLFSNRGYFWKLHIQYLVGKNIFQHLLEFHHLQYNSNTILDPWHLISPFPPLSFPFFWQLFKRCAVWFTSKLWIQCKAIRWQSKMSNPERPFYIWKEPITFLSSMWT